MVIKRHLNNNIPVLLEQLRNFRSVIIGIWVKVGSRHEPDDKSGISHFLEHMFFKGTKKRSARDIAIEIDSLGGDLNAFTSRENTAFYVKVLDEYLDRGVDLLTDIFLHSVLADEEIEKEKGVIREEIRLVEDTPDELIHDIFCKSIWGSAALGQPVLGRKETVRSFTRDDLIAHVRRYYGTSDTIIACAGNFDPDRLMTTLEHYLGGLRRGSEPQTFAPPSFHGGLTVHQKDLSEIHLCLGVQGIPFGSRDRYVLALLNCMLGSGVSSRLFQEIREKKGYAYSIYSFLSSYQDTGYWAVYAGAGSKRAVAVTELMIREMRQFPATITEDELQRAKDQLRGNIILSLESTNNRMQSIARQQIYYGRCYTQKEIMKDIEAVTLDQARDLAGRLIGPGRMGLTVLGPARHDDFRGMV